MRLRCIFGMLLSCVAACTGPQTAGIPPDGPQTAEAVLAKALTRPLPTSVQGLGRLDSYVKGAARKADLLVVVRSPDALQLQVLSPTSDLLAVMSTDGKRFVTFERGGAECHVGNACARNLARMIPIAHHFSGPTPAPEQLVQALLGRPPLLDHPRKGLAWDDERGVYRIDIGDPTAAHQEVFVHPGSFRFYGTVLYQGTRKLASVAYDGEVGSNGPPRTLRLRQPEQDLDVTVSLRDVEVGAAVDPTVFDVACPDGTKVIELPCEP